MVNDDVKTVFQDMEGNIWIGTYGSGIAKLVNEAFTFYEYDKIKYGNNVTSIDQFQGVYWLGTNKGVLKTSNGKVEEYLPSKEYFNNDKITALFVDKHGNIWIGTNSNGIYLRSYENKTVKRIFYSGNDLENSVNYITGDSDRIWVATRYGVFLFSGQTQIKHFTTSDGLPHNSINHIFLNDEGSAWISTISRKLFFISKDGKIKSGREIGSYGRNEFNSIVLDKNNYFWAATYGNGIYYFSTDSIYNIRAANGLKSDYCYSIICDDMNNIWVGHRKGFTKISADSLYLHAYGQEIGIIADCNLNSILLDQSGNVLFGTNNGLIKYDYRDAQKSLSPPLNNLISVKFNDNKIDWHKKAVLPYDKYKLNIDFIGISYRNTDQVTYQYKLENYDLDWSKRSVISEATYPRIEDGKYTFKLRSFNSEGQMSEIPLSFKFVIKKPFWKTWWFILSVSGFLVFAMIAIIKIRERNHTRFQAFLEKELNERTKEVVEKKNEIEDKNREITHTLTQNVDSEGSQDGMDMIICEINLKTNYLRFLSAMRPVILYMKDEQYYIRGNRSSIGGEVLEDKTFDDQEYQLSKGDIVYMFSDGYPDQFGGPIGKKFKMVRLKNMLDSIHKKSMSEQYDYIKNNFELWKGDRWQVDDVLFMGIQV